MQAAHGDARHHRNTATLAVALTLCSCGFDADDAQPWVERLVHETPRLAQLLFHLDKPPESTYATDGKYPTWIAAVEFDKFEWQQLAPRKYQAHAIARVTPGPLLGAAPKGVKADLTVDFSVVTWPPPIIFLPESNELHPDAWHLTTVDGQRIDETGPFVEYLSGP